VRGSQDVRAGGFVRDFVSQLDRMLMLESPGFDAAWEERDGTARQVLAVSAAPLVATTSE
jgi:hypothetical protein